MPSTHIIVGAGQAGGYAAGALRDAGFTGHILLIGAEPERPYERPPLSKAALTEDPAPPPSYFHPPERYTDRDITLRLGTTAVGLDANAARLTLADGTTLPYDKLLLATGGHARTLSVPGHERVLTLRTLADAARIRAALTPGRRVVCIGAGVIGLEIAASAIKRGCHVTVIEAGPRPMGRSMAPEISDWVAALHRAHGVTLHLAATVEAVAPDAVLCAGGLRVPADVVIAGIGMVRDTRLAEQAGLKCDAGILVDAHTRASHTDIHAAGDVAAFWHPVAGRTLRLESWKHAQNHGIAAGRAMAGLFEPYDEIPWFWTDQHGVNIQVAGLAHDAARTILRGDPATRSFSAFHLDHDGRIAAVTGINAPRDVRIGQMLIQARAHIDPALLADPARKLQDLAKAHAA